MKNLFFFITGWLLGIIPATAQNSPVYKVIDPHPNNPYQSDKADNVIATDSVFFIIDGLVNQEGSRYQKIVKTTLEGIILDTITLTGPYNDLGIADGGGTFITHDGYILFTGEWYNSDTGKMGAFLIKMNDNLNVIWEQYYTNPIGIGEYYGASVVETDDHENYLLYACTSRTYLLKTDTSGSLIWSKVIPDTVPQSINGNMIKTQDGNVLITTYVYNPNLNSKNYSASMAKVDYDGNLLWRKDVDNYTDAGNQQEPMATLLHNGGYAVMWANDSIPWIPFVTQSDFPSLYIMDENGVKEREVRFDRYGIRSVFSLVTAANGDIIGGGFDISILGTQDKGWLFRATADGDMIWQRFFSDSLQRPWSPIYFYDISENTDGSIVCVGDVEDSIPGIEINMDRNINMVLLVTDANGCLLPSCPGGLQYITAAPESPLRQSLRWLEVAPNPAQDLLSVHIPAELPDGPCRLELYDAFGRLTLSQSVDRYEERQELNLLALPSGYYMLALMCEGRAVARQKVVIQH
jgi:Secretion system C-terminal sorting domain